MTTLSKSAGEVLMLSTALFSVSEESGEAEPMPDCVGGDIVGVGW